MMLKLKSAKHDWILAFIEMLCAASILLIMLSMAFSIPDEFALVMLILVSIYNILIIAGCHLTQIQAGFLTYEQCMDLIDQFKRRAGRESDEITKSDYVLYLSGAWFLVNLLRNLTRDASSLQAQRKDSVFNSGRPEADLTPEDMALIVKRLRPCAWLLNPDTRKSFRAFILGAALLFIPLYLVPFTPYFVFLPLILGGYAFFKFAQGLIAIS